MAIVAETEAVIQNLKNIDGQNKKGERLKLEIDLKIRNVGHISKRIEIKEKHYHELTRTNKNLLEQ